MKFYNALNNAKKWTVKHSPELLTGFGVAGLITTTCFAVTGTIKATRVIDQRKESIEDDKVPIKDVVKLTWKYYIPTALSLAATSTCIILANSVNSKRNAALAAAYNLTEAAFVEYRNKVAETIGDKKEKTIHNEIVDDKIKRNETGDKSIIITNDSDCLCYDVRNDRYFVSNHDKIKKVENLVNYILRCNDYISLNEVYDEFNLNHVKDGDYLGWHIMKLPKEGLVIDIGTHISNDGKPCLSIDFNIDPWYKFDIYG